MSSRHRPSTLVLCYHAVSADWPDPIAVKPAQLERQLTYLGELGYVGATFSRAIEDPPAPLTLAVTFDDGYRSVLQRAFPILERLGIPGTVFVPSAYADCPQPSFWGGTGRERWFGGPHEAELEGLSWGQLRRLASAGWEVGSHTRSHHHLTRLDDGELWEELSASRAECEAGMRARCRSIAYPYGDVDERVLRAAAQAGYGFGGALPRRLIRVSETLDWPRLGIYRPDGWLRFRIKLSPFVLSLRRSALWPLVGRGIAAARIAR